MEQKFKDSLQISQVLTEEDQRTGKRVLETARKHPSFPQRLREKTPIVHKRKGEEKANSTSWFEYSKA